MATVLIAQGDVFIRRTFKHIFVCNNCTVVVASSGDECLVKAKKVGPDVILLDVVMPDMCGIKVLKKLKRNPKTKEIPVIVLAEEDKDEELLKQAEMVGIAGWFLKSDYTPDKVIETVRQYLHLPKN